MAYFVDQVVICDAYSEPDKHYQILPGGRSKLTEGRRPSKRYMVGGREAKGGIVGVVGSEPELFEQEAPGNEKLNDFINQMRYEIRAWREAGYPGTALVTRRLLEWWFERDEERKATGKRLFFCQREAIETVIYLYECQNRRKMIETGDLVRYALKLATGTGKTVVMATLIVWSTLHKRKVSGSSLSQNFLVLVPNLTVRDRVSGHPRGDGLDPAGEHNLYDEFEMVPPEYREEFHPNILVRNWHAIPLEGKREDWVSEEVIETGRFIPAAVLRAMHRRSQQDPAAVIRRFLGNWRDLVIINDEAHHAWGEKRAREGEDPEFIKWNKIIDRVAKAAKVSLVADMSATPWYGTGSPKPEGSLFEWVVSDFSVYDAFESGLVKVVRLPDPDKQGNMYLDLWDGVKDAKTEEEYILACKGAIASIYSSWKDDFSAWSSTFEFARSSPSPVLLCVADNAKRAGWLFKHLTKDYEHFRNPDDEDRSRWVTVQIDSGVFDADKGNEAIIREMVSTVGNMGKSGEHVRCIVSVNMLSEGWDVKSVTHILGLRAFGSPLLTEQIIGRGLRRTNYDVLNVPLAEREADSDETVDAFGIPFVGFPVEKKRKRPKTGGFGGTVKVIEPDKKKAKYAVRVPNVRAWAVGVTDPLHNMIKVDSLPAIELDPKKTPPEVHVKPVVGGRPEAVLTLDVFREEWPTLKTAFLLAQELFEVTNPGGSKDQGIGPTFDELLEVSMQYVDRRVVPAIGGDKRDIGIYYWRRQALDVLETAVRGAGAAGVKPVPILADPEHLESARLRRFHWTGIVTEGKRCHLGKVPCHTDLEKQFADYLDNAPDVIRYLKNERFGFSITYYENSRPRQYYPDFIVVASDGHGQETFYLAETKGEIRPNTKLKSEAAALWCEKMTASGSGNWQFMFVPQRPFEKALANGYIDLRRLGAILQESRDH